jgi:predicted HNH restriction endonuclease
MPKKLDYSSNAVIKSWMRKWGFMRSRERAKTLKDQKYTCQECGAKQSTAKGREVKVEVHHKSMIDWAPLIAEVRRMLLNQDDMQVLCKACHKEEHKK